jgi:Aspartyl protease/PDZ domain
VSTQAMKALILGVLIIQAALARSDAPAVSGATHVLAQARGAMGISSTIPKWAMAGTISEGGERGSVTIWTDALAGAAAEYDYGSEDLRGAEGFNGSVAWTSSADGVLRSSIGLPRGVLAGKAYVLSEAILLPRFAPYAKQIAGSNEADVIRFSPPGVPPFDVWFSRQTALPERAVFYGEDTHVYRFNDYRMVGAFVIPFSIREDSDLISLTSVSQTSPGKATTIPSVEPHDFGVEGGHDATVPVTFDGAHILVGVKLNGEGPFRFILDTGGHSILSTEVAQRLRLIGSHPTASGGIGSGTIAVTRTTVARIDIGNAYIRNQPFKIMDIKNGFGQSFGERIDGIVGVQLLMRFQVTIDYAGRLLTLSTEREPLANAIPFTFIGDMPATSASLGSRSTWFGIDTGSGASMILSKPYWSRHFPPSTTRVYGSLGVGVGGSQNAWFSPVTSFRWADFTFPRLIFDFADADQGDLATSSIAGYIGGRLLARFTVTFDYRSQTLRLVPNHNFWIKDSFNRSGLVVSSQGLDKVISSVLTGSPAYAAGVPSNSRIISIDKRAASELSLAEIKRILGQATGSIVSLRISRNNVERSYRFALANYI